MPIIQDPTDREEFCRTVRINFLRTLNARQREMDKTRTASIKELKEVDQSSARALAHGMKEWNDGRLDGMIEIARLIDHAFAIELQEWKTAGAHLL